MRDDYAGPTQQIEDYVGSLRPTTTGEAIRSPLPGDPIYTSNRESVYNESQLYSQSSLKRTQKDPRQGGVFTG